MKLLNRFIKYVKIDTQSDPNTTCAPSTAKQFDLANVLVEELKELGIEDVKLDDNCIVYAHIKANTDEYQDKIGFIAHMDTAPDMSGKDVKPGLVKNYKGGTITLNKELDIKMSPKEFPCLLKDVGSDLLVTDGTTLLGADDKAGVALIMNLCEYLMKHDEIKHGPISIAFTPDEEVGRGTENFDIECFDADYAYTVDGGNIEDVEYENFNAASAEVIINGLSIHPGDAKGRMINASLVAMEFNSLLPTFDNPAYTEKYEGFNHLCDINGECEKCHMNYIIRNHDASLLEKQKQDFINAKDFLNKKYGENTVELIIEDTYQNMISIISTRMEIVDRVKEKMNKLGIEAKSSAIRGGTDGAMLTYKGLLCPNLGTGGRNYHGKYEYLNITEFYKMADILIEIAKID